MKVKKSIREREQIEINGVPQRLSWIAQYHPEILLQRICGGHPRTHAYFSALAQIGLNRLKLRELIKQHPEWKLDIKQFNQM